MKIKKKFNNNVVLSEDDHQNEVILIGKAISFEKKIGDEIDENLIEKKYVLEHEEIYQQFNQLLKDVPPQNLFLTSKIIQMAEEELNTKFNNSIFIGIADHINYAIERYKKGEKIKNALLWEIKKFYTKEYLVAKKSLDIIHHYENIWLSDDEAGYIALHFVNGTQSSQMKDTLLMTEIVKQVVKIIKFHFNVMIDETSLNYFRLVTHLRYFTLRALQKETITEISHGEILENLIEKYPDVWRCIEKIAKYLSEELSTTLNSDEYTYLMIHVIRIIYK